MRHRLSLLGLLVLVGALAVGGLSGCAKSAELREPPEAEAAEGQQPAVSPEDVELAPTSGVVVSVMTPTPVTRVEPATGSEEVVAASPVPIVDSAPGDTPTETAVLEPTAVPPTEAPPDDSGSKTVWHTVQVGETLSLIASRYGTTVNAIVRANGISNPNQIVVGQRLKIPTDGTTGSSPKPGCRFQHTVRSGEWIWQIARAYGVSPYDILSANGLTVQTGQNIQPGRVLCIP